MLSRLPTMLHDGAAADGASDDCGPPPKKQRANPYERAHRRFREVCPCVLAPSASHLTTRLRLQVLEQLDAARKKNAKWTTQAETGVLCEYWARVATRGTRTFAYGGFSEAAVKWKLRQLKKILGPLFDMPEDTPAHQIGDVLADCRLLATRHGREQLITAGHEMWAAEPGRAADDADILQNKVHEQARVVSNSPPAAPPCPEEPHLLLHPTI